MILQITTLHTPIQKMLHCCTFKFIQFLFTSAKYIVQNDFPLLKKKPDLQDQCTACTFKEEREIEVSYEDVNVVMKRLGMADSNKCRNYNIIEETNVLLEEKIATMDELKEAFEVFDPDMDGFITPKKLWVLVEKLGLSEGMMYEDCERMIRVYDMDGDGRVSFDEFKRMMEDSE